jgi:hypothetical protein
MQASDIESARASVLASDDSPGKTRLLKMLSHSEQLLDGTHKALQVVGQNAANVPQFYATLFEIREPLQQIHDFLLEIDVVAMNLWVARESSYEAAQAVAKVIRTQSRELNELLWCLPRRRSATDDPAADEAAPINAVPP